MFHKTLCSAFVLILSVVLSCGGGSSSNSTSKNTGNLIINIPGSTMSQKSILPGGNMAASYIITGTGPGNASFTRTVSGETSVEVEGLVSGDWLIHVEALDGNGVSVGDGEETVTVSTGETLTCNIIITLFAGMGTLDLSINWTYTIINPRLDITLTSKGHDPITIPAQMNLTGSADVYYEINSGYYTLKIELYETAGGTDTHAGSASETVRVSEGMVSSKVITIAEGQTDSSGIRNEFPVSAGAPEGNDGLSSFSNESGPGSSVSGLSGAAYVAPPGPNNFGTVNLSYPIAVPAGRGGSGPQLSLAYSSNSGDGLIGVGWKLATGLGAISRTNKNGPICYDSRDTFTYNGSRLVKVAGEAGSENGTYRLEIESEFSRFELTNIETGGTWRIYDKSGALSVFGPDNSSRIYHPEYPNRVYSWQFSRTDDLNGNYIYALYDTSHYSDDHILYLKEIRYTGNSGLYGNPLPARQYVRFHLKDRGSSFVTTAPGFVMKTNMLLDRIEVGWDNPEGSNNTVLWNYRMEYDESPASGRPVLKTVESDRSSTQPEFIYEAGNSSFEWRKIHNPYSTGGAAPESVKYFQGDFNGDGISDIAFFNPANGNWTVSESRFDGGFNFTTYGVKFQGYDSEDKIKFFKDNATGDYDGNGRSDIAFYLTETKEIWIAESTGRNFEFRKYGIINEPNLDIFKCEWFPGDYDGNGLTDIVFFNESSGEWIFMKNTFHSFEFTIFSEHFMNLFRNDYNPDSNMDSVFTGDISEEGGARDKVNFLMGDFNGDGRSDISIYDSRDGKWWVGMPSPPAPLPRNAGEEGTGFTLDWKLYKVFTAPEMALFSKDRFTGDFNGDGLSDFLIFDKNSKKWIIGETLESTINFRVLSGMPSSAGSISMWLHGDFNGDGKTDIGFFSMQDRKFWIGEAGNDGFRFRVYNDFSASLSPDTSVLTEYGTHWIQGDFNGDGKADVGIFNLGESEWYFANSSGNTPDLIKEVKNGIGGTYYLEYNNAVTRDNTGTDNIPDLPVNYKICTKLTVEDGLGGRIVTQYDYKNAYSFCRFIDGEKESDYFGFGEFSIINTAGQKSVFNFHNVPYSDYRKNRALAGALKSSSFYGSDGVEYSRVECEYLIHEIVPFGSAQGTAYAGVKSYLIDTVKKKSYSKGVPVSTAESVTTLIPGEYGISNVTTKATDHYKDGIHAETSVSSYTEYETIKETNETRVKFKRSLQATQYETETSFAYDSRGNVIRQIVKALAGSPLPPDRVFEYEYDAYGNRTRTVNKSGSPWRVASSIFDNNMHQFLTESRVQRSGSGDYFSTTYVCDYGMAFGSPVKITGVNGNSSYFDYDSIGRLVSSRADTDSGVAAIAEYFYSTEFPLSAKTVKYSGTGGGNLAMRVYTDGFGRTIHSVQSGLETSGKRYTKSGLLKYDSTGRLTAKGQTYWADDSEIDNFREGSTLKYPAYYYYDDAGRQKKIVSPKAYTGEPETSVTFTYNDPWEIIETHSIGRSKRTIINARGQTLYVEDKGTGPSTGSGTGVTISAKMGFAYNIRGNLVKKTDLNTAGFGGMSLAVDQGLFAMGAKDLSGNNVCAWKYNTFGQLISSSDADIGYRAYEYNAFGALVSKTDALGRTTRLTYDAIGRVVKKTLPGDEGMVEYIYDSYQGSDNAKGRIAMIADKIQGKVFSYDRLGRRKSETRYYLSTGMAGQPEKPFQTVYHHDLLGRATRVEYPEDPRYGTKTSINYTYNSMGLAQTVKAEYGDEDEKTFVSEVDYNEFGQITAMVNGNGVRNEYNYDIKGRLSALFTSSVKNAQTQYMQSVSYSFNIDNSLRSIENNPTEGVGTNLPRGTRNTYSYDGFNRLISATGVSEDSMGMNPKKFKNNYSYAPNGNLLRKDIVDADTNALIDRWDYSYSNHAVESIDTTANGANSFVMQYDAVGNLVYETAPSHPVTGETRSKAMEYDSNNRITRVMNPDAGNEVMGRYKYDDQGFRVARTTKHDYGAGKKEYQVFYPSMFMCMEFEKDVSGHEVPGTYTVVNNIYLNGRRIAAMLPTGQAQYYLTDQVDSVKLVVDDQSMVKKRFEYMPYGESWFTEGSEQAEPMFGSKEYDEESGLYFFGARYYNPESGHFTSADSEIDGALDTQGWNRYMYCKGNPIMFSDPTGHGAWSNIGKGIKRSIVDSITYKYTYQDGGRKGVAAKLFTGNFKVAEMNYNRTNGWSVSSQVVNYWGAYIGWGWQQKGYHKGFNANTGGGYTYGYVTIGGGGTYYFGSKTMSHNAGISVSGKYGSVGVGYSLEHDSHGNTISRGWYGSGGVNWAGIAMELISSYNNNANEDPMTATEHGAGTSWDPDSDDAAVFNDRPYALFTQGQFKSVNGNFPDEGCAATVCLNMVSIKYTEETGKQLTLLQAAGMLEAAINEGTIRSSDLNVMNWADAANKMSNVAGLSGTWSYSSDNITMWSIFGSSDGLGYWVDTNGDGESNHFVNDIGRGQYFDVGSGKIGNISNLQRDFNRPNREMRYR